MVIQTGLQTMAISQCPSLAPDRQSWSASYCTAYKNLHKYMLLERQGRRFAYLHELVCREIAVDVANPFLEPFGGLFREAHALTLISQYRM